jgi:hypothetical protein
MWITQTTFKFALCKETWKSVYGYIGDKVASKYSMPSIKNFAKAMVTVATLATGAFVLKRFAFANNSDKKKVEEIFLNSEKEEFFGADDKNVHPVFTNAKPNIGDKDEGVSPNPCNEDLRPNPWYKNDFITSKLDVTDTSASYNALPSDQVLKLITNNCAIFEFHNPETGELDINKAFCIRGHLFG